MITAETILTRKSVRSYDGRPIEPEALEKVKAFAAKVEDPFGIPVTFVFLDAKEHGLSSPVLTGEPLYVAGKVAKVPYGDVAFGFAMEQLLLYAWSLGLGSVWIGGTMKRELFQQAAGLGAEERMPCISPLGYGTASFISISATTRATSARPWGTCRRLTWASPSATSSWRPGSRAWNPR